jgi:predicted MFS family arabinose efflux permease
MYVALLMNVAAVLLFALTGSMDGLIFALMILGFSAAFGKPVQQSYFLDRKAAVRYGEDRSIGVYNFTENIGESLGPIVFSRLTGAAVRGYMTFLAVVTGCCGLHFMMNSKGMKREE